MSLFPKRAAPRRQPGRQASARDRAFGDGVYGVAVYGEITKQNAQPTLRALLLASRA